MLIMIPYTEYYRDASTQARFTMITGFAGAVYCLFASAFFHTVLNVNESWLILSHKLDIAGIVVVCCGQQFLNTLIWANGQAELFWLFIFKEILFASFCIYDIMKREAGPVWAMRYPAITIVTTILATVSTDHREAVYGSVGCSIMTLFAGLLFFKGRFPERCCSKLDNYNSHVWHHVCIVIGIASAMSTIQYVDGL